MAKNPSKGRGNRVSQMAEKQRELVEMTDNNTLSSAEIREARLEHPKMRDRDFANKFGISEAQLVAAYVEHGAVRLIAASKEILPRVPALGDVMALTRNESCVIEVVGTYGEYKESEFAGIIIDDPIDMRTFPKHWVTAFAVEKPTEDGVRRSIQVFDAFGDAVHKIHFRDETRLPQWEELVSALKHDDQSGDLTVEARPTPDGAKIDVTKIDSLRAEWDEMNDTHQFFGIMRRNGMNRLGAYRAAGGNYARPVAPTSVAEMLQKTRDAGLEIMIFVGSRGCIEIFSGKIDKLMTMGPWENVLDKGFNLHLRADHIKEAYVVTKMSDKGPAVSLEAFDVNGGVILQIFGVVGKEHNYRPEWDALVAELPTLAQEAAA